MDKAYWTVKMIFIFVEFLGIIATVSLLYFAVVHIRNLTDEIRRLQETIRDRRRNG